MNRPIPLAAIAALSLVPGSPCRGGTTGAPGANDIVIAQGGARADYKFEWNVAVTGQLKPGCNTLVVRGLNPPSLWRRVPSAVPLPPCAMKGA